MTVDTAAAPIVAPIEKFFADAADKAIDAQYAACARRGVYLERLPMPMEREHFPVLIALAGDRRIWEHYVYDGSDPARMREILDDALVQMESGTQYPFVIFHKGHNKIIGSTRLLDLQPKHKKLEIGSTWLHPEYWSTSVNVESKKIIYRNEKRGWKGGFLVQILILYFHMIFASINKSCIYFT